MTSLKPIKFTTVYRTTTYTFTTVRFSEANYLSQLTEEDKKKWQTLSPEEKKQAWLQLKKDFPFEIDTAESTGDEHHNWIEDWDTEEQKHEDAKWDDHAWVKGTITAKIDELKNQSK
jgi:hypothetical protein